MKNVWSLLRSALKDKGVDLEQAASQREKAEFNSVLRGLYNRPDLSLPKEESWEGDKLTGYWDNQPNNESLELDVLRDKVISLMMYFGLARPSDLARLDVRTLSISKDSLSIRVFRAKNSGAGYSPPIVIPFLTGKAKKRHCAARALQEYLERTEEFRTPFGEHGVIPVFLNLRVQKPLSAGRISVLARNLLHNQLGLVVRAYSIRSNATSAAVAAGVDPVVVQKHGRWRSATVMANHYLNQLDTSTVPLALS